MIKETFVIKNVPTKIGIHSTVTYTFLMYYFDAHLILWGIFAGVFTMIWIAKLIKFAKEKEVDVSDTLEEFSVFQESLLKKIKDRNGRCE